MGTSGFGVRLFEVMSDGSLEPILGVDGDYFGGTVPNVGDTYAKWGLNDVYTFFAVQRRYFIDSPDADNGWCVIVREVQSAPQLEAVAKEWAEDTEFWRAIDEQEREEQRKLVSDGLREFSTKKKPKSDSTPAPTIKTKPRKRVLKPRPPKR